jgi:hypothetical protein
VNHSDNSDLLEPFLLPSLVSAIAWASNEPTAKKLILPILTSTTDNETHQAILGMLGPSGKVLSEKNGGLEKDAARQLTRDDINLQWFEAFIEARGIDKALDAVLAALSYNFATALDVMSVLICVHERALRDLLRLRFMSLEDHLTAQATVHLHRRVEAYASVMVVEDIPGDFVQLPTIEATTTELDTSQEQPVDDIDQVLNETAVLGSIEQPGIGGDVLMDDFYELQGDGMGLGSLDDLDLEMF